MARGRPSWRDKSTAGYAADKEAWFTGYAAPRMDAWVLRTGWEPPSYTDDGGSTDGGSGTGPGTAQS